MAKRPTEFDTEMVRSDSQVIPAPRVNIPMPKITPATAALVSKGSASSGQSGGTASGQGSKSDG